MVLPGARRSDDGDGLAGFDRDAHVFDENRVFLVAKADVPEIDLAPRIRDTDRVDAFGYLLFFLHNLADALRRSEGGLQDVGYTGRLRDWLGEELRVHNEGLDIAQLENLARGQDSAHDADGDVAYVGDEVHYWKHHAGYELSLPGCVEKPRVDVLELAD